MKDKCELAQLLFCHLLVPEVIYGKHLLDLGEICGLAKNFIRTQDTFYPCYGVYLCIQAEYYMYHIPHAYTLQFSILAY